MKKITLLLAVLAVVAGASFASANCRNGMALPTGSKVYSSYNATTQQVTVTVEGVKVVQFYHYNHEKGPQVIPPAKDGTFTYDATKGLGYNFTFPTGECSDAPFVLISLSLLKEWQAAGLFPYYMDESTTADCSRPDGTCCFIPNFR